MPRELTPEESRILEMIRSHYGPLNTEEAVTWLSGDEAGIMVRNAAGEYVFFVHLTNIAEWRLDGLIKTDEELRRDWLHIDDT